MFRSVNVLRSKCIYYYAILFLSISMIWNYFDSVYDCKVNVVVKTLCVLHNFENTN